MLKNIELFDKLSLRFNGRVLFIKDVIGDEICCWSFYGQGRKIAEVCCTSIVYATEKKQTKVDTYLLSVSVIFPLWRENRGVYAKLSFVILYLFVRWSSQRLESMKRPLTSFCMSPTMGGVQTMPCWRPQGAPQDDLIIWMRTRSGLSEFEGFISNDLMTALTTTSDFSFSTRRLCLWPWAAFAPCLCLTSLNTFLFQSCSYLTSFYFPGDYYEMSAIQPCVVLMWFYVHLLSLLCCLRGCGVLFFVFDHNSYHCILCVEDHRRGCLHSALKANTVLPSGGGYNIVNWLSKYIKFRRRIISCLQQKLNVHNFCFSLPWSSGTWKNVCLRNFLPDSL